MLCRLSVHRVSGEALRVIIIVFSPSSAVICPDFKNRTSFSVRKGGDMRPCGGMLPSLQMLTLDYLRHGFLVFCFVLSDALTIKSINYKLILFASFGRSIHDHLMIHEGLT